MTEDILLNLIQLGLGSNQITYNEATDFLREKYRVFIFAIPKERSVDGIEWRGIDQDFCGGYQTYWWEHCEGKKYFRDNKDAALEWGIKVAIDKMKNRGTSVNKFDPAKNHKRVWYVYSD